MKHKVNFIRRLVILSIITSLIVPYLILQVSLHNDLIDMPGNTASDSGIHIKWILKLCIYSFSYAAIYFSFIAIFHKRNWRIFPVIFLNVCLTTLLMWVHFYHNYYGVPPRVETLLYFKNLGKIGEQVLFQLAGIEEIIMFMSFLFCSLLSIFFLHKRFMVRRHLIPLILMGIIGGVFWGSRIIATKSEYYKFGHTLSITSYGVFYTFGRNLYELVLKPKYPILPYPGKINTETDIPEYDVPLTDVIILQVESLDNELLGKKIDKQLIMPFLSGLRDSSRYYENFFAQHSGGGSSDAELATFFSLLPIQGYSGMRNAKYDSLVTLPNILKENGYSLFAYHGNSKSFFNRDIAYSKMGFDFFKEKKLYTESASGWHSKDSSFFAQSLDLIQNAPHKSLHILITMQSHGPFRNYSEKTKRQFNFDYSLSSTEKDYFCTMSEVDKALQFFITSLQKSAKWENSLILIYGDHESGILTPENRIEHVPLFVLGKGMTFSREYMPTSHVDIGPIVTYYLGIETPKNWLGSFPVDNRRSVLFNDGHAAELNENGEISYSQSKEAKQFIQYSNSLLR